MLATFFILLLSFFSLSFCGRLGLHYSSSPLAYSGRVRAALVIGSIGIFIYGVVVWLVSNPYLPFFSHYWAVGWIWGNPLSFGLDSLSMFLVILTTFVFPFCFLMAETAIQKNSLDYCLVFVCLEILLLLVFLSLDFFFFYLCFEVSLIPMFILIGWWGARSRKMKAAYYLFLYTVLGSLFMLLVLIYCLSAYGTTNYFALLTVPFPPYVTYFLWPAVFVAFAVKIPMFPFHIWLPEAHVEAPTAGSVLLAGIVLKLGGYGMLRFLLPLFPEATIFYSPAASTLALMGALYGALAAIRQLDIKRIIAYSSIAHMNFGLLGLFSLTAEGLSGFYYIMLGHGIVSSALFFLVGVLYDRYHSRQFVYYQGLALRMPLFSAVFFLLTLGNTAFPGTINFPGELLVLCGLAKTSLFFLCGGGIVLFFSTIYSFWLLNRVTFGTLRIATITRYYDLTRQETYLFIGFVFWMLIGGILPNAVLGPVGTTLNFFL